MSDFARMDDNDSVFAWIVENGRAGKWHGRPAHICLIPEPDGRFEWWVAIEVGGSTLVDRLSPGQVADNWEWADD